MARKPPSWKQPTLDFQPDSVEVPVPQDPALSHPKGNRHAVQNDHPPIPPAASENSQPTEKRPNSIADPGRLRNRTEEQPRSLEGKAVPGESGHRPEPDREPG